MGFALGVVALIFVGSVARNSANEFVRTADQVTQRQHVLDLIADSRKALNRAEAEQRGFLLTGSSQYLQNYDTAPATFEASMDDLRRMLGAADPDLDLAEHLGRAKLDEMQDCIRIYKTKGPEAARALIGTNLGLNLMTRFRETMIAVEARQRKALATAAAENRLNRTRVERSTFAGLIFTGLIVVASLLAVLRDLRKRTLAESRLEANLALQGLIFDSVSAAIIATDGSGRVTLFNAVAQRWLGYSAEEVFSNPAILDLIHDQSEVEQAARELEAEYGEPVSPDNVFGFKPRRGSRFVREWTFVRKDGTRFPVLLSISAIRNATGETQGLVGIAVDLTQEKAARAELDGYVHRLEASAKELQESRDVALAATRTKSEFLANMSHEIRTPMNGVMGMAHLLQSTPLTERQKGFVRTILQSAESLLTILNDILDLSKMEAGKMTLEHFPFDLRILLEDICESQAPAAHAKGLELGCVMPPSVPEFVLGDPGRLRQILTNLVSNAVKFTSEGEVTLSASVVRHGANRITYRISVRDTGIGIPPDRQERIFESFTQADGSTTRKYGGTGLGLTICRQLVELMGGAIGVMSEPGKGSEFWLEIPLHRQESPLQEGNDRHDLGGRRILIADDNATNRIVLRELLTHWNCQVVESATGEDAVDIALRDPLFDCVVLDMHMPGMDGVEVAQALRKDSRTSAIPLVLLSSSGISQTEAESESLFDAVIFKPIRSSPLYSTISHVTGGAPPAEPTAPFLSLSGEEAHMGTLRVLVVEDNVVNQMVATELLESWGCQSETADNGAAAVALYGHQRFDVILMDVQMPVMDGYEATSEIRRMEEGTGRHIPIFAMTANAMSGDRERCLKAGMDGYLSKPLQPSKLRERLLEVATEVKEESMSTNEELHEDVPLFEAQRLDETCAGKASLKLRVIERYIATSKAGADAIEAAAAEGDAVALASAAHGLKGSSLTVGSPLLSALCERIEHSAREGRIDAQAATMVRPSLLRLYGALEKLAKELLPTV
ncbi:hybrid sensor histidine kinase/response regulator [Fimbriimonas ginsengisoli]|uniref:Circadian input-output histidine kinase CikA n=1 Tax=Fimbriimonas ginsengisoli Gsoil 348 TaxID=661478 RepID=A0A068NVT3_FIMGI|nr:response regulator [Fimbriimonas ginsengisoli]AIE86900.1 putative hybrid histidine kinase [Fimbriimonas ginsengisoli Gsoil 348]